MDNYVCNKCNYDWYQKKAHKCAKCGSRDIIIQLPEDHGLIFTVPFF